MALHAAARDGNLQEIDNLLAESRDEVDGRDKLKRTALHLAAWAGQLDAVKLLLSHGAKPDASAMDDMNALHFAAQKGHHTVLEVLLDTGLNPNSKTRKGVNALQIAAQQGHTGAVQLLLKRGGNPLSVDKHGKTAAQLAKTPDLRQLLQDAEPEAREKQQRAAARKEERAAKPKAPGAGGKSVGAAQSKRPADRDGSAHQGPSKQQRGGAAGPSASDGGAVGIGPPQRPSPSAAPAPAAGPAERPDVMEEEEEDAAVMIGPIGPPERPPASSATGPGDHEETEAVGDAAMIGPPEQLPAAAIGPLERPQADTGSSDGRQREPKKARVMLSHLGNDGLDD